MGITSVTPRRRFAARFVYTLILVFGLVSFALWRISSPLMSDIISSNDILLKQEQASPVIHWSAWNDAKHICYPFDHTPGLQRNSAIDAGFPLGNSPDYNRFKDVVLCINYNFYQSREVDEFLHSMYHPYFRKVILLRPAKGGNLANTVEIDRGITYFHCENWDGGYEAYICLGRYMNLTAAATDTGIEGYLYIGDDVAMRYSKIKHLDLNKVWFDMDYGLVWRFDFDNKDVWGVW